MPKKIQLQKNNTGGLDLLTERDSGNEVLILTGKKERSLEFWKKMKETANDAIYLLEHSNAK